MTRLRDSFTAAGRPKEGDLPGTWVLISFVTTEELVSGQPAPERAKFDINGIRRADVAGSPLEWAVTFDSTGVGTLEGTSHTVWQPTGDVSPVRFTRQGDLLFEKDFGSDYLRVYRCRAASARRLVCLMRNAEALHGLEFLKRVP